MIAAPHWVRRECVRATILRFRHRILITLKNNDYEKYEITTADQVVRNLMALKFWRGKFFLFFFPNSMHE